LRAGVDSSDIPANGEADMRVLLAEDDRYLSAMLAKGLREHAYAVDVAGDGEDAVYQAAVNDYDLVILDVLMPKRDGFDVCRDLRRRGMKAPVLMLTAKDEVADRVEGLDAGADDYLAKPFDFSELLARLRALLRRGHEVRSEEIVVGDLVVDTRGQVARRGGRILPLTTKEYALLEYLARNAGRVVGRADICAHVWDDNHDPFSNAIEVYINRLRRKVDGGLAPLIHTRRGAGYLLSPVAGDE
jgi:two-component system copper resistance phosphate regulon response regulator CusR